MNETLHEKRCETCGNKKKVGTPMWASVTPLNLGYKCMITGEYCDERYLHVQVINKVGCASHIEDGGASFGIPHTETDGQTGASHNAQSPGLKQRCAELEKENKSLNRSREFYQSRCTELQKRQSKMRDPERKIVCDILANGFVLKEPEITVDATPVPAQADAFFYPYKAVEDITRRVIAGAKAEERTGICDAMDKLIKTKSWVAMAAFAETLRQEGLS